MKTINKSLPIFAGRLASQRPAFLDTDTGHIISVNTDLDGEIFCDEDMELADLIQNHKRFKPAPYINRAATAKAFLIMAGVPEDVFQKHGISRYTDIRIFADDVGKLDHQYYFAASDIIAERKAEQLYHFVENRLCENAVWCWLGQYGFTCKPPSGFVMVDGNGIPELVFEGETYQHS